jgi:protein TonB
VTQDDYPASALREEAAGTTATRLSVGADGRVTACDITGSSGNASLDQAACRNLQRRARFEPALDRDGNPVASSFPKRIVWRLPEN